MVKKTGLIFFMNNNPFTSKKFVAVWSKHHDDAKPAINFNFIKNLSFTKNKHFPLYINSGKNLTNAMHYSVSTLKEHHDYKNKVFLIYDVPSYFEITNNLGSHKSLKLKKIKQYKGYLANLKTYTNLETYINDNFSSRSNRVFKKCIKRLELSFNITYKMYYGDNLTKDEYDFIFDCFKTLLRKRYDEKQINNHFATDNKLNYLHELMHPLIQLKQASIFVIYNSNVPISISLNYNSDNILFGALTVFDTDYSKFNIGYIDIMKHLDWCLNQKIQIFDFSKGEFDYKKRWGNTEYDFEYHVFYDDKSLVSILIAYVVLAFFSFKQYLRRHHLDSLFHKVMFLLKGNKQKLSKKSLKTNIIPIKTLDEDDCLELIDIKDMPYTFLRKHVNDFLFKYEENQHDLKVFKLDNLVNAFVIKGKNNIEKIIFLVTLLNINTTLL